MPIIPIQFAHQVCDEFLRYFYSAFPLTNLDLVQQEREILSCPSSLDIRLVRGPYVFLSVVFTQDELIEGLTKQKRLHRVPDLIWYTRMGKHQQRVFTVSLGHIPCTRQVVTVGGREPTTIHRYLLGLPIPFILSENCLWLDRIPSGQPHPWSCENGRKRCVRGSFWISTNST